jgi:hypothetical protein
LIRDASLLIGGSLFPPTAFSLISTIKNTTKTNKQTNKHQQKTEGAGAWGLRRPPKESTPQRKINVKIFSCA